MIPEIVPRQRWPGRGGSRRFRCGAAPGLVLKAPASDAIALPMKGDDPRSDRHGHARHHRRASRSSRRPATAALARPCSGHCLGQSSRRPMHRKGLRSTLGLGKGIPHGVKGPYFFKAYAEALPPPFVADLSFTGGFIRFCPKSPPAGSSAKAWPGTVFMVCSCPGPYGW